MNFNEAAKKKHERGAKEHGDWSDLNPVSEMMDELLDIYNYSNHPKIKDLLLCDLIRVNVKKWWAILDNIKL